MRVDRARASARRPACRARGSRPARSAPGAVARWAPRGDVPVAARRATGARGRCAARRRGSSLRDSRVQLHAVPRGLGAIAAGRHVAPAPTAVLRLVLEDATAPWVGAPADASELVEDERIGRVLDDGDEQPGECVTDGDEGARKGTVRTELDTPGPRTAAEHAIDLAQRRHADVTGEHPALGERTEHGAHA